MTEALEKARYYVEQCGCTCALVGKDEVITSIDRGVAPLLKLLDAGKNVKGFSAADKVLGKGSALLYVLLGVFEIHTGVISLAALEVLKAHGISVYYEQSVENIINRKGDGPCPIETALEVTNDPMRAVGIIKNTLRKIKGEKNENS